jgi:hypothetical protein
VLATKVALVGCVGVSLMIDPRSISRPDAAARGCDARAAPMCYEIWFASCALGENRKFHDCYHLGFVLIQIIINFLRLDETHLENGMIQIMSSKGLKIVENC